MKKRKSKKLRVFEENCKRMDDDIDYQKEYKREKLDLTRNLLKLEEKRIEAQKESEQRNRDLLLQVAALFAKNN